MAWTVDDNWQISFVTFKTEVFGWLKISWHCWDTCFDFFFLKEPKSFSVYLLVSPICFTGWRTDLFHRVKDWFVSQGEGQICSGWSQNPNVVIEKSMCLSPWQFLVTSSPLATYHLGKYWFVRMLIRLKRAIGTFNNFVKIFGASPSPKHKQRNSYRLPEHWNLTNFWEF